MEVNGKVAVVTGATKGIGKAIAQALVEAGVKVSICGRNEAELHEVVSELNRASSGGATGTVCDVRNYEDVVALFRRTADEFGGVDLLVNNAGIGVFDQT